MYKKYKSIRLIIVRMEEEIFQPKNDKQRKFVKDGVSTWKSFNKVYTFCAFMTVTFFAFFPLLDGTAKIRQLPFPTWIPINYKRYFITYELICLHQVLSYYIMSQTQVNIDCSVCFFMNFVAIQYQILADNAENLHVQKEPNKIESKEELSDRMFGNLIKCVRHHQEILK